MLLGIPRTIEPRRLSLYPTGIHPKFMSQSKDLLRLFQVLLSAISLENWRRKFRPHDAEGRTQGHIFD